MWSLERRDDLGPRLGSHDFGRTVGTDIRIGKLVDEPLCGRTANNVTGNGNKRKMTLIGYRKSDMKDDITHAKGRQRLEQGIVVGWILDPGNEGVKAGQYNTVSKQSSAQILCLRRDELAVFVRGGNAMYPKVVHGCFIVCHKRHRATKFAAHAQPDGLAKIAQKLRLVWKRLVEIRPRRPGPARVNRGCRRHKRGDQQRSQPGDERQTMRAKNPR